MQIFLSFDAYNLLLCFSVVVVFRCAYKEHYNRLAHMYPNMINCDAVNFSDCHFKDVMG